jgi:CheY-like chemotaxis protein
VSDLLWGKLIDAIPALAWVAFALVVYLTLRRPMLERVLPRLSQFKGLGLEITLTEELLRQATEATEPADGQATRVTPDERRGVLRRLDHATDYLSGGRVLWVDDHPEYNQYIIRLLRQVGMRVDLAHDTDEALVALRRSEYDIVLSDIRRGDDFDAGLRMPQTFREHHITVPVVIFTGNFDSTRGVDPMIFAGTNRIDDLVNYVIDLMERARLTRD